jgi:hypothetical protein
MPRQAIAEAGRGERAGPDASSVSRGMRRLHGQALPRGITQRAQLPSCRTITRALASRRPRTAAPSSLSGTAAAGGAVRSRGPSGGAGQLHHLGDKSLQIPEQRHRQHYGRATIQMRQYPDGSLALFDGPRCWRVTTPMARSPQRRWPMPPNRPASSSLAACSPASRALRAAQGNGLRPRLTQAPRAGVETSGRDKKTALQPNQKTMFVRQPIRTYHALHTADISTPHRQRESGRVRRFASGFRRI